MGRKRKTNRELPERVYMKHGAYYFVTTEKKWIRLGVNKKEMYESLAVLQIRPTGIYIIEHLWKDYCLDHVCSLSPATQKGYKRSAIQFLKVFGSMMPGEVKSSDVAQYLMIRGRKTKTCANGEIRVLSAMYTHAVSLGICELNPCLRVKRHKIPPRDRYIEDWELTEFLRICDEFMSCYVTLKYLIGVRQTDMLMLTLDDVKDDGLFVRPNKTVNSTGETRIFLWTPDLKAVIERVKKLSRPKSAVHLFCQKNGKGYLTKDFDAPNFGNRWGKLMAEALKETALVQRFQEKDIRAKTATDADDDGQNATEILGHEDTRTTRIYIRSKQIKRVSPLIIKRKVNMTNISSEDESLPL